MQYSYGLGLWVSLFIPSGYLRIYIRYERMNVWMKVCMGADYGSVGELEKTRAGGRCSSYQVVVAAGELGAGWHRHVR